MPRYSGSVPSADDPNVWVPRSTPTSAPKKDDSKKSAAKAALQKALGNAKAGSLLRRRAKMAE